MAHPQQQNAGVMIFSVLLNWPGESPSKWMGRAPFATPIFLSVGMGALGGARPLWNSALLGPLFLISGASTGAALMMLFPLSHGEHESLRRWDMGAIAVEATLIGLYLVGLLTGGGQAGQAG